MRFELKSNLPFHHAAELKWLNSHRYRLHKNRTMLQRVLPTVRLHYFAEPAVDKVFAQITLISMFGTRNI